VTCAKVNAGYDVLETVPDPNGTSFDFSGRSGQCAVPGAMFDIGCTAFTSVVQKRGIPIVDCSAAPAGARLGLTDTIVHRKADAVFDPNLPFPRTAPAIPIELVDLSLVSVAPITVTGCSGGPQQWEMRSTDSKSGSITPGTMTVIQADANGGTFTSSLSVCPLVTFRRLSDNKTFNIDVCRVDPNCEAHLSASGCWSYTTPPQSDFVNVPKFSSNFVAGYCPGRTGAPPASPAEDPRVNPTRETDPNFAIHYVAPARSIAGTIPTLSAWGLMLLVALLGVSSVILLRRRRNVPGGSSS